MIWIRHVIRGTEYHALLKANDSCGAVESFVILCGMMNWQSGFARVVAMYQCYWDGWWNEWIGMRRWACKRCNLRLVLYFLLLFTSRRKHNQFFTGEEGDCLRKIANSFSVTYLHTSATCSLWQMVELDCTLFSVFCARDTGEFSMLIYCSF